jgi:hypothetical protein
MWNSNACSDCDSIAHTNSNCDANAYSVTGQITLSARGYKVRGQQRVDLCWNGAISNNIDIYRNGALIATVPNIPAVASDGTFAIGRLRPRLRRQRE